MAVVLLVGGGLLLRSFSRLMAVDPGFRAERVLTLATSLPAQAYRDAASVRAFYTRLVDDVSQVPGVSAVGASTELPLGVRERRAFTIEQEPQAAREFPHSVAHQCVMGRYFEAVGIPLKRGRYFTASDAQQSEPVAIINETMARRFWGTADPVGERIDWGNTASHGPWMRIVGVVGDVKQGPLNSETVPHTYTPWVQVSDAMMADNIVGMMRSLRIAVRSEVEPDGPGRDGACAHSRHRSGLASDVGADDERDRAAGRRRCRGSTRCSSVCSPSLALLLAAIGVGGMLAMSISRRLPELGVRMALGAQRRTLVAMVIRTGCCSPRPALLWGCRVRGCCHECLRA